ncbi:MAG: helix-turn-helix domain-containing protein [Candidatus Thermoplasmatota archaeon]|nr:helix-turn-helix domain-containing protein [Candidatus Thermoplasmatota archaeon]
MTVQEDSPEFSRYIQEGDKVERVYRILLSKHGTARTWYRIAKDADVSYGWAYRILKGLEHDGLIDGSKIIQPKGLFLRWAERRDLRLFREYNVQQPDETIAGSELDHAFTGYFAENHLGQYLFPRYREFYIKKEDMIKWHQLLTKHGYVGKGNTQVLLADDHVFFERQHVDSHSLVSIQQLIVDLYRTGAECAEAADLLVSKSYL